MCKFIKKQYNNLKRIDFTNDRYMHSVLKFVLIPVHKIYAIYLI